MYIVRVDFPGLGVNSRWIAITNNMFTIGGTPQFVGVKIWVIDKATALAGGPLDLWTFEPGFDFQLFDVGEVGGSLYNHPVLANLVPNYL